MAKKVFLQDEPIWLLESVFIVIAIFSSHIFGLLILIFYIINGTGKFHASISVAAIFLFLPIIMYPVVISRFSWNVHMDENKVWMNGDTIAAKRWRIQTYVAVNFSEIVSMQIENSSKNSSGQSISCSWFYGPVWTEKRYLVFITTSGKKKRMHVSHFTEPALAEIIDKIADQCEKSSGPYDGQRAFNILFKH